MDDVDHLTTYHEMWRERDRWRELASRFLGAACDGEKDRTLQPLAVATALLRDLRRLLETKDTGAILADLNEDPDAVWAAVISAEMMLEKFRGAVEDGVALADGKESPTERMEAATIAVYRHRFGELAAAARRFVALVPAPSDPKTLDALNVLQSALPEPKDTPIALAAEVDPVKAAAVCTLLADFSELEGVQDIDGPSEVLAPLADAVRLALEACGKTDGKNEKQDLPGDRGDV